MLGCTAQPQAQTSSTAVYRPRRPARTILHKAVRTNLETYIVAGHQQEDFTGGMPPYSEAAFRAYLKCGILATRCCHEFHSANGCYPCQSASAGTCARNLRLQAACSECSCVQWRPSYVILSWRGVRDDGQAVAAGIFYYRLQMGPDSVRGKLVLVK